MSAKKSGLVTLQLDKIDMTKKDILGAVIESAVPIIVQTIIEAVTGDRSKGCGISGTIHSGGGGSITITCSV